MKKTKILYVVNDLSIGGVTNILINTLNAFDYKKYDIDLLLLNDENLEITNGIPKKIKTISGNKYFGINSYRMKDLIKSKKIFKIVHKSLFSFLIKTGLIKNYIKKKRKLIIENNYDCEIAFSDGFATLFTAFGETDKKICWFHSDYNVHNYSPRYTKILKVALDLYSNIVGVSEEVSKSIKEIYSLEKVPETIINIQDFDKVKKLSNEEMKVKYDPEYINIVSVGRLEAQKAYLRYVDVHNKLIKDNYKTRFYLIGDGSEYSEISEKIDNFNLNSSFILLGYNNNPFPYIKNADLFVLPSIFEGMPTVVFESMALKTPVLSTKVSGINYLLGSNKYGIIVENSEDGLYSGLKKILDNPTILKDFKNNLKRHDVSNEKSLAQIYNLIDK